MDVTGTAYTLRLWNAPEYLVGPNGETASGSTSEAVTIPAAITYVRRLNDKWAGGFDGGAEAVWQTGFIQTYSLHNAVLGASYKASEKWRVGFALVGFYNGITFAESFSGGIVDDVDSAFVTGTDQGTQSHAFYDLVELSILLQIQTTTFRASEVQASAHELTFNLGGGLYF